MIICNVMSCKDKLIKIVTSLIFEVALKIFEMYFEAH